MRFTGEPQRFLEGNIILQTILYLSDLFEPWFKNWKIIWDHVHFECYKFLKWHVKIPTSRFDKRVTHRLTFSTKTTISSNKQPLFQ